MCLITRFPRIKTKKDIEVYKVLKDDLTSPYQGYQYLLNTLVESDLKISCIHLIKGCIPTNYAKDILPNKIIEPRLFYNESIYFKYTDIQDINLDLQAIEDGLHSYRDISKAMSSVSGSEGYIVCKAIIPAGSYIYINYNEIVSDKLIIKERVL